MTGMSLMRPCVGQAFRLAFINGKPVITPFQRRLQLQGQVSVRNSGHNVIPLRPSQYEFNKFKNDLHFYLLLGFVPMFAFITAVNLFIGPAELSDIPEEYEPKEWEYYKSPITRVFAKYVYEEPQKEYERTLHSIRTSEEDRYRKQLETKVRRLQKDRHDYKGWYWVGADKALEDEAKRDLEAHIKNIYSTK